MVPNTFLASNEPRVEEGQARAGHHQNQRRAHQHPVIVAGALGGLHGAFQIRDVSLGCRRNGLRERQSGVKASKAAQMRFRHSF